jgi:hypothetical protein
VITKSTAVAKTSKQAAKSKTPVNDARLAAATTR